ncbi:S-layer homology domain-containing protein [Paenibacillus sp. TRM 82003]|nr:S-layer homology domain-containing protein [Paenibacillus sp. TRM 82003]
MPDVRVERGWIQLPEPADVRKKKTVCEERIMLFRVVTRQSKRALASLLALSMFVPALPDQGFAASPSSTGTFSDIKGHWAEGKLQAWIQDGFIRGYSDASFKPDGFITRAEFMSLVNRAFGYTEAAEISFHDVAKDAWYYQAVAVARAAGYIDGDTANTVRPQDPITRQEAAKMIAMITKLEQDANAADSFRDASSISAWSRGFVGGIASAKIMLGYADQSFKPLNPITRAEAVVALHNALELERVPEPVVYDKAGTYQGQTLEGNVSITAAGVVLKDTNISGNLTIAEEVGEGEASLENVTVDGTTFVLGGGANSVYLTDSELPEVKVNKRGGNVRIVAEGSTQVDNVLLESGAILEEDLDSGAEGFGAVEVGGQVSGDEEVVFRGEFTEVNVRTKVKMVVEQGAVIGEVKVEAAAGGTEISGSGTVKAKGIHPDAKDVKISTPESNVTGGGGGGSSSNDDDDDTVLKPSKPTGTTNEWNVAIPVVEAPLPAVRNGENAADGTLKNIVATNPFIKILDGFDNVWSLNQPAWRDGTALVEPGANGKVAKYGDGPTVYFDGYKNDANAVVAEKKTHANVEIRDPATWVANIKYVEDATRNRTDEEALAAYYDDQRDKIYSMMEAFGPLANTYVDLVKPTTSVVRDVYEMNLVLEEETVEDQSQGLGPNPAGTELAGMLDLVSLIRFRTPASSNPSKYFYSSPRPWRMNSNGEVVEVVDENGKAVWETIGSGTGTSEALPSGGKKSTGPRNFQQYESNVEVIPALRYIRRKAEDGMGKDGAFPSGHTSASYLTTLGFAYAVPERYAEFMARAAQMGENRIVTGMHSPLDIIGARIQATAMVAYALNKEENQEVLKKAYDNAGEVFGALAAANNVSLYEYAHTTTGEYTFESAYDEKKWENHDANKAFYREKMTYGLPQTGTKGLAPVVPEGAEALLETRQPYLTDEQRREVLYTTSIDSGYAVLDASNGWGRIDLVTAADGYGAFLDNVTVDMDASKGRFNAQDWWRNDIGGSGLLTKKGTGTLTLTGNNSYAGGTLLQAGTLEAESTTAFGTGDLYVENGNVAVDADGALEVSGRFTMDDGALRIAMDDDSSQVTVNGILYLGGGDLKLDFSDYAITGSKDITLITAGTVVGKFDTVVADGYEVTLTYEKGRVIAHVKAK